MRLARVFFLPIFLFITFSNASFGQAELSYGDFMKQVMANHPVIRQAAIEVDLGNADLRLARAVTDPYVAGSLDRKDYDGKQYYDKSNVKLALPTALGAEFFVALDQNTGELINPETSTPNRGLYQTGVSIPIGSSIFFNERMLAIRQGKIMVDMAKEDQRMMVNDLLYRASLAYLNWSLSVDLTRTQEGALRIANEQFQAVQSAFIGGDRPAIDTTEAFLQVQNRTYQLLAAQNLQVTARLLVEVFLWDEEQQPLGVIDIAVPDQLPSISESIIVAADSFLAWQQNIRETHPSLRIKTLKIRALNMEQQMATSNILPQLDFKYAQLAPGTQFENLPGNNLNERMLGVAIKYPLLLRKERAKISLTRLKQETERLDRDVKTLELQNKTSTFVNDYNVSTQQQVLYNQMVANYQRLLAAERAKFNIGESSVFLLNSRENKLFDAQVNQLQVQTKRIASALKVIQVTNREGFYNTITN